MTLNSVISAASGMIVSPDLWLDRLPHTQAADAPRLDSSEGGARWLVGDKQVPLDVPNEVLERTSRLELGDVEAQLRWLSSSSGRRWLQERDGAVAEVLYSVGALWDAIADANDDAFVVGCYRAYNDWAAEVAASDPDGCVPLAKIPPTCAADATNELQRACCDLGLKGAILDRWPAGRGTDAPTAESESFFETAASISAPISIHAPLSGDRPRDPAAARAGRAPSWIGDVTKLAYGNVFDRHPTLRIVAVTPTPGFAPQMLEGLNETYMRTAGTRTVNLGNPDLLPSDYLREHVWYTCQSDAFAVRNQRYFGASHLLWASFAAMNHSIWPNSREVVARLTAGSPTESSAPFAFDAAASLYGIAGAPQLSQEQVSDFERYALL